MRNKRVILINPPPLNYQYRKYDFCARIPVGLLSVGSVLAEAGYLVNIIDGVIDPEYFLSIMTTRNDDVLFYGISCMTAQIPAAVKIGRMLRKIAPDSPIVWGGVHPSLFPEQTVRSELVDLVVVGEGEYTSLEIANALRDGGSLHSIDGIACERNGSVSVNRPREPADLDKLPLPRYDIVDIERYLYKNIHVIGPELIKRSMVVHSGLGCPFNCAFASIRSLRQNSTVMVIAARAQKGFSGKSITWSKITECRTSISRTSCSLPERKGSSISSTD